MLYSFLLLLLSPFTPHPPPVYADVIYLKSGGTLKGLVVEQHRDRIVVSTEGGEQTFFRKDVDDIFFDDPERNYLYLGSEALDSGDFDLARGLFQKSLQIRPHFPEAEEAIRRLDDLQLRKATPLEKEPDPLAVLKSRWGLELGLTERYPQVRPAREGSLAARMGLLSGDLLISVWGSSAAYLSLEDVSKALLGPPGSQVRVTLRRNLKLPKHSTGDRFWPGMTWEMDRLGLTVTAVTPGGVASSQGFLPLDRVTAIHGRSTRYLPLSKAQRILEEAKDKGLDLTIERDLLIFRE